MARQELAARQHLASCEKPVDTVTAPAEQAIQSVNQDGSKRGS